ncbi:hypothetical protein HGM15179_017358 [Zosterops borbonicus]|uniref:NAD(P)(+)--arginine ADP-ribosyltransferase n=1 Tax=Zosterops borbonicus TaxID=364589 RepID=A0A8K1G134_9PASS|nr:hypothetical protein HGM15179_017358 [Zosterops borbonicus]
MTVATVAIKVVPLDMTFDDQYQGCGPAMTVALLALNCFEFQKNPDFALFWTKAVPEWHSQGSRVSPLSSPDQTIAIMAYTMPDVYTDFNAAVPMAGHSPQEYQDNFHFKTLHFLLTQTLRILRDTQNGQCLDVVHQDCGVRFEAQRGDSIWFGQFLITWLRTTTEIRCPDETEFQVHTCHGAGIQSFSQNPEYEGVMIPPFETFEVTKVTREGDKTQIQLHSTGTSSKYICKWLKGDTTGHGGHCGHHDHQDKLDPQSNEGIKATKATTATLATMVTITTKTTVTTIITKTPWSTGLPQPL